VKTRDLLIIVAIILVLAGGDYVMSVQAEKDAVRKALREAAVAQNVDPDIMEAIGYVESRWRLGLVNNSGPDGARGGSYGPTQISQKTARAYGYAGDMNALANDAKLAALWTAIILRMRPGGPPETLEDAAAWWNAGRVSFTAVPADNTARTSYLPQLVDAYNMITEEVAS
jgi:hypothetical protein